MTVPPGPEETPYPDTVAHIHGGYNNRSEYTLCGLDVTWESTPSGLPYCQQCVALDG